MEDKIYDFDMAKAPQTIIKVIGVGGGGGNAVSNMYREGIRDVSFVLCNTDNQALQKSDVPDKLLIGQNTTHGLGSGNVPEVGERAAIESEDDIRKMLNDGTRMAFVTAGMGGGTGTGAAPVVAKISKDMGILTVGIVTIPFVFEGRPKIVKALRGVRNMAQNVDSLLVINNERLRNFADMPIPQANRKADETLTIAAKSIAEIVTTNLEQNVDFADVDTTMRNSGVALISIGFGEGEGRLRQAINEALENTLVNDVNNIFNAQRVAFVIYYSHEDELRISEMDDIHDFMSQFKTEYEVKWGHGYDDSLGHKIKITILVTGFGLEDILTKTEQLELNTDEEIRAAAEKAAAEKKKRDEEDEWMQRYYGDYIDAHPKTEIVVLTTEELDDDNLIAFIEEKPAYKRTVKDVQQIRNAGNLIISSSQKNISSSTMKNQEQKQKGGTIISF
ncbi:MAG: cell division protein FtsZ [Parabacteroides sp.]|nr:cell division protein FtsZ [Parabacteroides sp.]